MQLRGIIALVFAVTVLNACSGGGGGGQPPQPQVTLSGTVAGDAAIPSYSVDILSQVNDLKGGAFAAKGTTGADGRYSATSFLPNPPFFITASPLFQQDQPQYPRLTSIAHRGGNANVTALTSLVVAQLLNRSASAFGDFSAGFDLRTRSESDVRAAQQQVLAYLSNRPNKDDGNATTPVDVSVVADFVSTPLNAVSGDPHFEALRRLHASMMDSETLRGMEEHMLFRNDPPADLRSILDLDFVATCALQVPNTDDGTLPRGTTRVILDRRAITVGSVDLPFQQGDQLRLEANQSFVSTWTLGFATGQIELNVRGGRVDSVLLSTGSGSTRCVPTTDVSVSGKHPSLIALIRLFRQSLTNSSFSCAGPITVSGFVAGPNALAIEASGALRINGAGGPAVHLPSFLLTITGSIAVTGSQVQAFQLTRFHANGRFDAVDVALNAGQITSLMLNRQRDGQANQTQNCG
jgi:hypothetical protein